MCEPERSRGPSLRAVAAVLAAVAMTGAAVRTATSAAEAIGAAVLAACALGAVFTVRFVAAHGGFGVVVKRPVSEVNRAALPAARRAVEAPRPAVEGVIISSKEAVR